MSQQWHSLRAENIGGSDIAALFGESPYSSKLKLWHQKKGDLPADDLSSDENVMGGNFLEQGILDWANWKFGTNFTRPNIYMKHPGIKGMACTPDALDGEVMAQVKKVNSMTFGKKWEIEGDIITNAPLHILLQVQHELACAGKNESHLIVLVGGMSVARMIVYRDDAVIAMIEKAVVDFWQSIEANDPPAPDFTSDGQTIQALRQRMYISEDPQDMSGDNELSNAFHVHDEAKERMEEAEETKKAAAAQILYIIDNRKKVVCGPFRCTVVDNGGTPDKIITADMVGRVEKGRRPFSYPKITKG